MAAIRRPSPSGTSWHTRGTFCRTSLRTPGMANSAARRTSGHRTSTCQCRTACCGSMRGKRNIGAKCWPLVRGCARTSRRSINSGSLQPFTSWQRFEDYYDEGALIWLDADTLIRERSKDKRSLDDFARAFFGIRNGSFAIVTFTFDDVVKALNAVEPYDWSAFLRQRLDSIGKPAPLDGLRRGGDKLVATDTPGEFLAGSEEQRKRINLTFSIGVELDDKEKDMQGVVSEVIWDSPAF